MRRRIVTQLHAVFSSPASLVALRAQLHSHSGGNSSGGAAGSGGSGEAASPPPPTRRRRALVPEDEEYAELLDTEERGSIFPGHSQTSRIDSQGVQGISHSILSAARRGGSSAWQAATWTQTQKDLYGDERVELPMEEDEEDAADEGDKECSDHGSAIMEHASASCVLTNEASGEGWTTGEDATPPLSDAAMRWQEHLYTAPVAELHETTVSYLRTTVNPQLVSASDEHIIFPAVMDRLYEFHVEQMLDLVKGPWARSSLARYGVRLKDLIRDRIAQLAVTAATAEETRGETESESLLIDEDEAGHSVESPSVSGRKAQSSTVDVILSNATDEITANTVLRALVVMGLSAGHRKRDVQFFEVLGAFFVFHINTYKDPHDLVHVLTAFARAKIVPPQSFLGLIGRRLPVLAKKIPLEPLSCYRAMSNLSRMGYTQMDTFRFLSDCICDHIKANLAAEKQARSTAEGGGNEHQSIQNSPSLSLQSPSRGTSSRKIALLMAQATETERAKQRIICIAGFKPATLTRWLFVLAHLGAPYQLYLRPLITPLLVPALPHLAPPSFSRLVEAARVFRCSDAELIEPLIDHMVTVQAPRCLLQRYDLVNMLLLLSYTDTPIPKNFDLFISMCCDAFSSAAQPAVMGNTGRDQTDGIGFAPSALPSRAKTTAEASPPFMLRPRDMWLIADVLRQLQLRPDVSLEVLAPFTALIEDFALRLSTLLSLGVVSLEHVNLFLTSCERQQHPDTSGAIARLAEQRQEILQPSHGSSEADRDGEGSYYARIDVDVRETLRRIFIINDSRTYGTYRPLPGAMQVDFREELTKVCALDVLRAVDLHERASPGVLRVSPRRLLSRGLEEKLSGAGEEVQSPDGTRLLLRAPVEQVLTRADLKEMVELLQRSPLRRARKSPVVWRFVRDKAERLQMPEVAAIAREKLAAQAA